MGNSMDSKPGRTRDEASRGDQDMEDRQSFPMGLIECAVSESNQSRKSRPHVPVQEIWSRGFQLFDDQPIVRQSQSGEQFQVGDP